MTEKTEWYTLKEARCQLLPYSRPRPGVCRREHVYSFGRQTRGPLRSRDALCGRLAAGAYDVLGTNWQIACDIARENGREMDRALLRLVAPMHIAESREQAMRDVKFGLNKWVAYFTAINPTASGNDLRAADPAEEMVTSGRAVIGTPDDAIAMVEKLEKQSGGFGCMLMLAHNWANFEATKHSYELFARHVLPHFNGSNWAHASLKWYTDNGRELIGKAMRRRPRPCRNSWRNRQPRRATSRGAEVSKI